MTGVWDRSTMDAAPRSPAPLELPLGPALLALSLIGIGLALRAHRSGAATLAQALLRGSLPGALWVLVAGLNPDRPTWLRLTPFGVSLALGFLCGSLATRSSAARAHTSPQRSLGCYLCTCSAALLCARAVMLADPFVLQGRGLSALLGGGLSLNGALLGGVAAARCCFRREPLRFRAWLDGLAPALGLALAFGSFGAYLQGPTRTAQLGACGAGLLLCGLALGLGARQRFHGQSFLMVALGYGIVQLSGGASRSLGSSGAAVAVASWLLIGLAAVAGWVWHKGFTYRRI
jgi:hypothetical protein